MIRHLYEAFRRDNPNATVELLVTGHFELETHVDEIAASIHQLLQRSKQTAIAKAK